MSNNMANPRKFSEKIALHNQKQAEGNAAFEAIMREVSETTKVSNDYKVGNNFKPGSLPNVNSRTNNLSIDLQGALLSLESMKQQAMGHQYPPEYGHHSSHSRQMFHANKRVECPATYSSSFLSLPPDSSWRRSSSDSALHASAINGQAPNGSPSIDGHCAAVTSSNCSPHQNGIVWNNTDMKREYEMGDYRPKSCELNDHNNCNMYPAPCPVPLPVPNNTGSLPDLSSIQFPSPLTTPIDREEQCYVYSGLHAANSNNHMSSLNAPSHVGAIRSTSPVHRRRHVHAVPSPLILHNSQSSHVDVSQGLCVDVGVSRLSVESSLLHHPYVAQSSSSSHSLSPHQNSSRCLSPHRTINHHLAAPSRKVSSKPQQQLSPSQSPIMSPYRRSPSDSPTSPLSQRSYSPALSPMIPASPLMPSTFPDSYYFQHLNQTSSLQQQFEQFSMGSSQGQQHLLPAGTPNCSDYYQKNYFNRSPLHASSPPQQASPISPHVPHSPYNHKSDAMFGESYLMLSSQSNSAGAKLHIPDIILTGVDESFGRQDFAKELGHAMAGIPESFEHDLGFGDDAMKMGLDPLDTDSLQMLSDPCSMVTDPATEDSFRLDDTFQQPTSTAPL